MATKKCKCGKTLLEGEKKCENCNKKSKEKWEKNRKVGGGILVGIILFLIKIMGKGKK